MKKIFIMCFALLAAMQVSAQGLKFNSEGEFKIAQFTDLHYRHADPRSNVVFKCMDEVVAKERPDLLVLTGDIIYSKPGAEAMKDVLDKVSSYGIPFVTLYGNHDGPDCGTTNEALFDQARKAKNCIMPDRKGQPSPDYVLPVKSADGKRDAALVYCFDTHTYSTLKDVDGYAWLTLGQVEQYVSRSSQYTKENDGSPVPSVAFIHIPLPEYNEASANEDAILIGTRMEKACAPKINSGMFAAMKQQGDVMAVFAGHDHDNDYAVMWKNILLAYGRFTGGNTEYNHLRNGARMIVLKEGKRSFDTYIHQRGGKILDETTYPDSYVKDDWTKRPLSDE